MALETGTYISDLNVANPTSADPKSEGDDHLRLLKSSIKNTFPNVNGAVTASPAELNILDGATLDTAELNVLDGMRADTAELNILNGATMTTVELNYIDGVTSPIQPQIDSKAPIESPTLTGTPRAPTAPAATSGTQIATLDFVNSTILTASLPGQAGNAGALLSTDGANANWTKTISGITINQIDNLFTLQDELDPTKKAKFDCWAITPGQTRTYWLPDSNTTLVGENTGQTLINKTINQKDSLFTLQDDADTTKQAKFECSSIATGTTRTITIPDENVTLGESGLKLLLTVTAANSATVDLENVFNNAYDKYMIEVDDILASTASSALSVRFKIGGTYLTTGYVYSVHTGVSVVGSEIFTANLSVQYPAHFSLMLQNPENATMKHAITIRGIGYTGTTTAGVGMNISNTMVGNGTSGVLTGLRFYMSTGNISTGNFRVYGLKK